MSGKRVSRHWITGGFLGLALVCYVLGMTTPATALLLLGVVAEGIFWVRLLKRN